MSETVEVKVDITVYDVECEECGKDLDFAAEVDGDGDIRIKVEPCPNCREEG